MINGKRIAVVMPAYNAEKTLEQTVRRTVRRGRPHDPRRRRQQGPDRRLARKLGVHTFIHDANYGYGGNQKTCYRVALGRGR